LIFGFVTVTNFYLKIGKNCHILNLLLTSNGYYKATSAFKNPSRGSPGLPYLKGQLKGSRLKMELKDKLVQQHVDIPKPITV